MVAMNALQKIKIYFHFEPVVATGSIKYGIIRDIMSHDSEINCEIFMLKKSQLIYVDKKKRKKYLIRFTF